MCDTPKPCEELPPKSWWQRMLIALAKLRDGLLLLAGAIYLLGYLSWAFFATLHHMGYVPVLEAQYFAAGIFPAFILAIACLLIWILQWFRRRRRKQVAEWRQKTADCIETFTFYASIVLFLASVSLALIHIFSPKLILHAKDFAVGTVIIFLGINGFTWMVTSFLGSKPDNVENQNILLHGVSIYVVIAFVYSFAFYIVDVFQNLPQSFGGPKLECVQLDVTVANLSPDTLALIAPSQLAKTNLVVRSQPLYLVLQSGNYVVFQTNATWSFRSSIFKIKNEVIQGIFPVDVGR